MQHTLNKTSNTRVLLLLYPMFDKCKYKITFFRLLRVNENTENEDEDEDEDEDVDI